MSPGVKIFGSPTSAEVARVLACLFEKDVEFQLIRIDAYKGLHKKPNYLKLQMSGQDLTYEDEKLTMLDSRAICRHIAEKYANQGTISLIGSGTLERASIEQWLLTEAQIFDPPSSALVFHLGFGRLEGYKTDEVLVEKRKKKLSRVLDIYNQRLEESSYLAGDKFSLADLSHLPNAENLMKIPPCREMFEKREKVMGWWNKISSRTSWKKVVEMQKETPMA